MLRIDVRLVGGGAAMIAAGILLSLYIELATPAGTYGMTDDEIGELLLDQRIISDAGNLVAILLGVGMLLVLLSFGTKMPRRGGKSGTKKTQS